MSSALSIQARRLAGLLAEPGIVTRTSPFGCGRLALFRSGKTGAGLGAGFATREAAWELVKAGVARWSGSEAEGRLELVVKAEATRDLAVADVIVDGAKQPVLVDLRESPLLWLHRRPGRDGRPQISDSQFAAGERFRADLTRAAMLPRTTMNWEAVAAPEERGGQPRDPSTASDVAVAARQRVRHACDRLGPELSGLAMDVCGFLKGLDAVERERGWPARSAKVVLRVALDQLAEHYGIVPPPGAKVRGHSAWRAPDARSGIAPPA